MPGHNKVSPGQSLSTSPLRKAAFVNDLVDVVNHVKGQLLGGGAPPQSLSILTDCVKIKNLTGADRVRGECVKLGNYLLTTLDYRKLWFEGNTPASPVTQRYAILREPVLQNGFIDAQISGACIGRVDVLNTSHRFATPVASSCELDSAESGPIELLQTPGSTGVQDIVVRVFSPPTAVSFAIIHCEITSVGPPIEAEVIKATGTYEEEEVVELENPHGWTIEVGMLAWAMDFGDGSLLLFSIDCPAE